MVWSSPTESATTPPGNTLGGRLSETGFIYRLIAFMYCLLLVPTSTQALPMSGLPTMLNVTAQHERVTSHASGTVLSGSWLPSSALTRDTAAIFDEALSLSPAHHLRDMCSSISSIRTRRSSISMWHAWKISQLTQQPAEPPFRLLSWMCKPSGLRVPWPQLWSDSIAQTHSLLPTTESGGLGGRSCRPH